jgi:hypothetical protein
MSAVPNECCARLVPPPDGYRAEGAEWACPRCGQLWVWIEDEAEGAYFVRVVS